MKIDDLKTRTIAIYAGRFHPFHHGHAKVFHTLASKFGNNSTYITTSGKMDPDKSPFSFEEKSYMMQAAGINAANIVEEPVPYTPNNVISRLRLNPELDSMVFGVGQKDMDTDPRFTFAPLKDGSPSYFQHWVAGKLQPLSNNKNDDGTRQGHGYIYPVDDFQFTILGKTINSSSEIRALYKSAEDENRAAILNDLYPNVSDAALSKLKEIFDRRLG